MRFYQFSEARRNPEQNPKISVKPYLKKFIAEHPNDLDRIFVHFSTVEKLGVNMSYGFNTTPMGIYGYPIKYALENIGTKFGMTRPYVYVFRAKDSANLLNLSFLSDSEAGELGNRLLQMIDRGKISQHVQTVLDKEELRVMRQYGDEYDEPPLMHSSSEHDIENFKKSPNPQTFWKMIRSVAFHATTPDEEGKMWDAGDGWDRKDIAQKGSPILVAKNLTKFIKMLGYDGVVEARPDGIIHRNDPSQAVFFGAQNIDVLGATQLKDPSAKGRGSAKQAKDIIPDQNISSQGILRTLGKDRHHYGRRTGAIVKKFIKDPWFDLQYCRIMGKRWPEAEPYILDNIDTAINYALHIIKAPWDKINFDITFEKMSNRTRSYISSYIEKLHPKSPSLEKFILREVEQSPEEKPGNSLALRYVQVSLANQRWPEYEHLLLNSSGTWPYMLRYADVVGRWPEYEKLIITDPRYAASYAKDVLKKPWPEAEPYIKNDEREWMLYARYFNMFDRMSVHEILESNKIYGEKEGLDYDSLILNKCKTNPKECVSASVWDNGKLIPSLEEIILSTNHPDKSLIALGVILTAKLPINSVNPKILELAKQSSYADLLLKKS